MTHRVRAPFKGAYNRLVAMGVPVFFDDRHKRLGNFAISGEEGNWANFYSEAPDWAFGVHPKVDAVLTEAGLFAEWVNPGYLNVYER